MAIIYSYPTATPVAGNFLLGTQYDPATEENKTVQFTIADVNSLGTSNYLETTVTLTNAQWLSLNATPVELIATPGAGKAIKILAFSIFFDYSASNFTFNADIQAKIDTTSVVTTLVHGSTSPMAADTITTLQPLGGIKLPLNKALKLHGGGTTAGGGSVQVKVRYQVLDTSLF
jgi:hypothetical protein